METAERSSGRERGRSSGSRRPTPAPRTLGSYVLILREHWLPALVAGVALFALQVRGVLVAPPTYFSHATLKFERPRDVATGMTAAWSHEASMASMVEAEMYVMRSRAIAEDAAGRSGLYATVGQRDAWRPLEVALRRFSLGPALCELDVRVTGLPVAADASYTVSFDGTGTLTARRDDRSPPLATARAGEDGVFAFDLDGRGVRIAVVQGEPAGKTFDLVLMSHEHLADWIQAGVSPSQASPGTGIVRLGFLATVPERAQAAAQAVADAYLDVKRSEATAQSRSRIRWLGDKMSKVAVELEEAESRLDEHVRSKGTVMLSERAKAMIEDQSRLLLERMEREQEMHLEKELMEELAGAKGTGRILILLGTTRVDTRATALTGRLADLEIERGTLLRLERTKEHPEVVRLEAEMTEAREQLSLQVESLRAEALAGHRRHLAALEERLRRIRAEEERLAERMNALPADEREIARLQRDVDAIGETYAQVVRWQQEAELDRESAASTASLVDRAVVPTSRLAPVLSRSMALAGVLSLLAAAAVALFLDWRDRTIRTPQRLEEETGLPLYAAIPAYHTVPSRERRGLKGGLPTVERPHSVISENYRTLRANLRFANVDRPIRTLAITSSVDQEGKTVTTLNLATVLAQGGSKVVVVDADLRRPSTHRYLRGAIEPGLVQVLGGSLPWRSAVRRHEQAGFDVIHAGGTPPNPGALLESPAFSALVESLSEAYEYVLFDVPPVLAAADAAAFFARLDGLLLLARDRRVTPEIVAEAQDRVLRLGGNLLGCVFNAFDARRAARRAYGYGYSGYYAYGYSSAEKPSRKRRQEPTGSVEP
jgi:capsular exopolysaccharide synthesis family protein